LAPEDPVASLAAPEKPVYRRYKVSSSEGPLRQGEIISGLVQVRVLLDSIGSRKKYKGVDIIHPLAIIVTQDCDLEQDFKARDGKAGKHRILPNILFCEVELATELRFGAKNETLSEEKRARSAEINSKIWPNIEKNKDERYHFLQRVQPEEDLLGEGLNELAIEFKRYFTIPTDEVYFRISNGSAKRRCKLESPYLEHFSVRFHYYHYRVALPEDHISE
jgi:hypothetical protein